MRELLVMTKAVNLFFRIFELILLFQHALLTAQFITVLYTISALQLHDSHFWQTQILQHSFSLTVSTLFTYTRCRAMK